MIALDTNVLARLVTNDDPVQAGQAVALIDMGTALFVPLTVMLELEWVLRGAYGLDKSDISRSFEALLSIRNILFERQPDIHLALQYYQLGFDFADALHHTGTVGCKSLATFDQKFEKRAAKAKLKPQAVSPASLIRPDSDANSR